MAACAAHDPAAARGRELVQDVVPVRRVLVDAAPAAHRLEVVVRGEASDEQLTPAGDLIERRLRVV